METYTLSEIVLTTLLGTSVLGLGILLWAFRAAAGDAFSRGSPSLFARAFSIVGGLCAAGVAIYALGWLALHLLLLTGALA